MGTPPVFPLHNTTITMADREFNSEAKFVADEVTANAQPEQVVLDGRGTKSSEVVLEDFINLKPNPTQEGVKRFYQNFKTFNVISCYNFKGGVGKTTSTFALGCELARNHANLSLSTGHEFHSPHQNSPMRDLNPGVLLVDLDPQCSLTALALRRTVLREFNGDEDFGRFFQQEAFKGSNWNVYDAVKNQLKDQGVDLEGSRLKPAQLTRLHLTDQGVSAAIGEAPDGQPAAKSSKRANPRLYLLPGDLRMSFASTLLEIASEKPEFVRKVGVLYHLIWMTAAAYNIHTVLLDLPPSLGGVTKVSLLSSHYFLVPFFADFFSREAIVNLTRILSPPPFGVFDSSNWASWLKAVLGYDLQKMELSTVGARYPFPDHTGASGVWADVLTSGFCANISEANQVYLDEHGMLPPDLPQRFDILRQSALGYRQFRVDRHNPEFVTPGPKFVGSMLTMLNPEWTQLRYLGTQPPSTASQLQSPRPSTNSKLLNLCSGPHADFEQVVAARRMQGNHQRWYDAIKVAFDNFLETTDPCFRLTSFSDQDKARARDYPVLEQIEDANQLIAISQRESCPVHLLQRMHLRRFRSDSEAAAQPEEDEPILGVHGRWESLNHANNHLANIRRHSYILSNLVDVIVRFTHPHEPESSQSSVTSAQ